MEDASCSPVIGLSARVFGGELRAGDDLEAVAWLPLSGPLPEMAFAADSPMSERYPGHNWQRAPVDPDYAGARQRLCGKSGRAPE